MWSLVCKALAYISVHLQAKKVLFKFFRLLVEGGCQTRWPLTPRVQKDHP